MRRTSAAVIGTLGGTALLLAAKFGIGHHGGNGQNVAAPGDPAAAPSAVPSSSSPPEHQSGHQPGHTKTSGTGLKSGSYTGAPSVNRYGTVQVSITVAGGRITGATATYPTDSGRSQEINTRAVPILRQETLTAQNARVSTVSGASFTSSSYRSSLQTALSKAQA